MKQFTKASVLLLLLGVAPFLTGFSLIGPFKNGPSPNDWQAVAFGGRPQGLGYTLAGDVGGPMTTLEGYRWNVPVITYGFDESFIRYFGNDGMTAVSNAFQILNDLPPFSAMSADLSEFPWDSKEVVGFSPQLNTLGLVDLKSQTLAAVLEQLGLAKPERYVWCLRSRFLPTPNSTNYTTIQLNYDPVTYHPSQYVNGVLYHFQIFDALGPQGNEWASAVEFFRDDPFYLPYSAVAGGQGSSDDELLDSASGLIQSTVSGLSSGEYYVGLTRDDIGGLRFLYGTNNWVTELLMTNVVGGQVGNAGSPWINFLNNTNAFLGTSNVVFNTNALGTNLIVRGLRPGMNKLTFKRVEYDSLIGQTLIPYTNQYTDTIITNGHAIIQAVTRPVIAPDMLFAVNDLGLAQNIPVTFVRSGTAGWQNNDAINGVTTMGGPGVIQPQVTFTFSDLLPFVENFSPSSLQDSAGSGSFVWGSFDGTTNAPIIFYGYGGLTFQDIKNAALGR